MQVLTSLMLAILACAGLCAVLIGNPVNGIYLQDVLPSIAKLSSHNWIREMLGVSQWQLQSAWTSAKARQDWNILYHIGGNGPWIQKIDGVVRAGFGPPPGCHVEQVNMVSMGCSHPIWDERGGQERADIVLTNASRCRDTLSAILQLALEAVGQ